MSNLDSDIKNLIYSNCNNIADMATRMMQTQLDLISTVIVTNEKEQEAVDEIRNTLRSTFNTEDGQLNFDQNYDELYNKYPYLIIAEEGMAAPISGGSRGDGYIIQPDGSLEYTNVPAPLWGQEIPALAKAGTGFIKDTEKILDTMIPQWVDELIEELNPEIEDLTASYVSEKIKNSYGGK